MNYKNCEVITFFSGGIHSYYQIKQWQKPFEELNKKHKMLYIITDYEVYNHYINDEQNIEVIFLETFTDLIEFYQANEFAIILYINNSLRNFQSLRYSRGYHIHLNHGESEKESMRSNQSQAYDFIFTVAQRGVDRYKEYLLNFSPKKYIQIGRPQLDFIEPLKFKKQKKQRVILYAPTWEATHKSMNYSSIDKYGEFIVSKLLEDKNNILIYKPHSAAGSRDEEVKIANDKIKEFVKNSPNAFNMEDENINNIFTIVDFALFDNTSVMIDYLYTNKPAAYIEILEDQSINELTKAFITLDKINMKIFDYLIKSELNSDTKEKTRKKVKTLYLGEFEPKKSTKKFIKELSKLIKKREKLIKNIKK